MPFGALLNVPKDKLVEIELAKMAKPTARTKKLSERGCDFCPQNKTKGVKKLFTKVRGKKIMVVTTTPGRVENEEGKLLLGDSGKFFWDELEKVGITRKECDVQAAVRCFPADSDDGELTQRDPKKEEIFCCTKYSDEAKEKSSAQIYIVLGGMAHTAFLGKEFKKSRKIFWSDTLKAKVYCLAHPNYFLRGQFPQNALREFRDALKSVSQDLGGKVISQYAYVESQDYKGITNLEDGRNAAKILKNEAAKGTRITVDTEFDEVAGELLLLSCAFTYKPGQSFVYILDHPKARKVAGQWLPLKKDVRNGLHAIVADIMSDVKIKKALHHGSADVPVFNKKGIKVKGFDYDTEYAEFLADPDGRSYGLNAIGMRRYPQFGDYKTIILPEVIGKLSEEEQKKVDKMPLDKQYAYVMRKNRAHFSQLSLKKLVLRNGADADLTKRIEMSTRKKISLPLLSIYKDAAFVLAKMEPNGPDFDFKHLKKIKELYPPRFERVLRQIRKIAKNPDFNPSSPKQLKVLLFASKKEGGLGIVPPDNAFDKKGKKKRDKDGNIIPPSPSTGKNVLEVLGRTHLIARLITEFRRIGKMISTYINAYEECAKKNKGRLRTKWWLTGTRTGRLSSGGEKGEEKDKDNKIVNLQNIHGDPNLQNLCTADKDWRKVYVAVHEAVMGQFGNLLEEIRVLVFKIAAEKDKDKRKALEEKLKTKINALKLRAYNSIRFQKLCKRIVKKYGNVNILLGFDQGQIEVRVMAQVSGDKNLIKDCMSSDIHSKVGHAMTGWPVEKIKKDKKTRTLTKNIHFGILFGLSAAGLMNFILVKDPDSTIDEEEAQRLYNNYFKAYPGVRRFIEWARNFVEEHGYIENMFGFKRPLSTGKGVEGYERDDDNSEGDTEGGSYWGNQAINTPVQGAAHQLMLMAVAMLKRKYKKYKKLGVPTLEVHDYIGWKTPLKDLMSALPLAKELLEKEPLRVVKALFPDIDWKIPLVVEGKAGFRLGDSVDLEDNKKIHEILFDMFIETFVKEVRLEAELKLARTA